MVYLQPQLRQDICSDIEQDGFGEILIVMEGGMKERRREQKGSGNVCRFFSSSSWHMPRLFCQTHILNFLNSGPCVFLSLSLTQPLRTYSLTLVHAFFSSLSLTQPLATRLLPRKRVENSPHFLSVDQYNIFVRVRLRNSILVAA